MALRARDCLRWCGTAGESQEERSTMAACTKGSRESEGPIIAHRLRWFTWQCIYEYAVRWSIANIVAMLCVVGLREIQIPLLVCVSGTTFMEVHVVGDPHQYHGKCDPNLELGGITVLWAALSGCWCMLLVLLCSRRETILMKKSLGTPVIRVGIRVQDRI